MKCFKLTCLTNLMNYLTGITSKFSVTSTKQDKQQQAKSEPRQKQNPPKSVNYNVSLQAMFLKRS